MPRLDIDEIERLIPIEGTPINMLDPKAGCPFAPRCDSCMKVCIREMPPPVSLDGAKDHHACCWLLKKKEGAA
jgi:oligopeptide transport system ATP-binding protein